MATEDWSQLIQDFDAEEEEVLELPPPKTIDLNPSGNLQKEIKYEWVDPEQTTVIRTERTVQIIEEKKRISKNAFARKQKWVKFGRVAQIPKGELEKGISAQREGAVPFLWSGQSMEKFRAAQDKKLAEQAKQRRKEKKENAMSMNDIMAEQKRETQKRNVYKPPMSLQMEGTYEIRISNLPDHTEWGNIKQLMDAFYKNHLGIDRPPRYKIRMFTSKYDQEQNAVVEFDNEKYQQLAIKELNGHPYEYQILKVEKSIPRR